MTRLNILRERLARKNKQIALLKLARDHAQRLGGNWQHKSDTGWLTSMVANAGGTLLAVLSGAEARQWLGQATEIDGLVTEAFVDRRLLELEIERLLLGEED